MVYVSDSNAPKYIHPSYDLALKEAKRLAESLNRKTYVLQSITEVELTKFTCTNMTPDGEADLPF